MAIHVYDFDGVILTHYVLPYKTINEQCYCLYLGNIQEYFDTFLEHSYHFSCQCLETAAPAVAYLLDRCGWEMLYHAPYSPNVIPCNIDFIPKMKEPLNGISFRTIPDILAVVNHSIQTINRTGAATGVL